MAKTRKIEFGNFHREWGQNLIHGHEFLRLLPGFEKYCTEVGIAVSSNGMQKVNGNPYNDLYILGSSCFLQIPSNAVTGRPHNPWHEEKAFEKLSEISDKLGFSPGKFRKLVELFGDICAERYVDYMRWEANRRNYYKSFIEHPDALVEGRQRWENE